MNTILIDDDLRLKILRYYVDAGMDYAFWSRGFSMHFGFANLFTLLSRERMLQRMSEEVLSRLRVKDTGHIHDFGCGVGATMRKAAELFPEIKVTGVTLVPWQKEKGDLLNRPISKTLEILTEDYHHTSIASGSSDGIYAIESACYSPKAMQGVFFREIHRVLKPGRRIVIADGFLKVPVDSLPTGIRKIYNGICHNWALPGMMNIDDVRDHLAKSQFRNITCEEISWRVAPSVIHVPFVILWFLLYKKARREKLSQQSSRNLKGSFQTLLLGLQRKQFGYYLVTAEK
jgi:MPBQ/MSBQ methyltransferase